MPRLATLIASVLLGALSAGLVACGSEDERKGLLPVRDAESLLDGLDRVDRLASQGRCDTAASAAGTLIDQAQSLGQEVNRRLREALVDSSQRLRLLLETPEKCEARTETLPTETQTVPTVTVEPETTTTEPEATETVPPGTGGGGVGPDEPEEPPEEPQDGDAGGIGPGGTQP
jgi:hypothetical protein